jgi:hypothetical protein
MSDKLPSIDDFAEDNGDLPSIDDIIKEENLPSVEDFIVEEPTMRANDPGEDGGFGGGANNTEDEEEEEEAEDLTEVLRLINDLRRDIPDVPEIKYYDEELQQLSEQVEQIRESIPEVPEVKDYDAEVEAICEQIDIVREYVEKLPEIKHYDEQITSLEDKAELLKQEIINLPEIKHYDDDLKSLKEEIREEIWEIKNTTIPDFKWIGNTFDIVHENFETVQGNLGDLKDKLDQDIQNLAEDLDTKDFEKRVEIKELKESLGETKDKIYDELKETALRIWEHRDQFKDDDRKLKKFVLGKFEVLRKNVDEQIDEFNNKNIESQNVITESLREYFDTLKDDISNLPKVQYYDEDIIKLKKSIKELSEDNTINIKELYRIVEGLQETQNELKEGFLAQPPSTDNSDPLTPLDRKATSFDQLAAQYRLFTNRVQDQLAALGGGGAVRLENLEDVGISTYATTDPMGLRSNQMLIYNGARWVGIASTAIKSEAVGAAGTWVTDSVGIHTTKKVGIGTTQAKSDYQLYVQGNALFTGNVTGLGTVHWNDVTHVDSTGISTFQDGINVTAGGVGIGTTNRRHALVVGNPGAAGTSVLIHGDTRIVGVLTVGESSITIDGTTNTINIGDEDVTITNSQITIGENVSISATATGINSAPNVYYVAKDGDDDNNGTSIDNAFLTISAAVGAASSGTTIKVLSGNYVESNPLEVPAYVSIVGDDQRTVNVSPSTPTKDLFHVRKATKLANMTFKDHLAPAAAVGFPTTEIAENVGGGAWKGPYIQNCTSQTTTGTGIYIDGDQARLLKAMNVDAFTQYNQGGVGVAVTNNGFAQLVSVFTICCDKAITCHTGGQADVANSNCSFGTYGLVSNGLSDLQYSGIVTSSASVSQKEAIINISTDEFTISGVDYTHSTGIATITTTAAHNFKVGMGVTLAGIGFTCDFGGKTYPYRRPFVFDVEAIPAATKFKVNLGISTVAHYYAGAGSSAGTAKIEVDRPYDGQLVYFDTLYEQVQKITMTDKGSGYTSTPTVTIEAPAGPSGETASAYATVENGTVDSITIISSGSQYTDTPDVTISGGGGSDAAATATMYPIYYKINSSTPVVSGITTLTLDTNLLNTVGVGSTAYFAQASKIIASSHTFEYVGAGNNITEATPKRGGVTVQANEVLTESGGLVLYTSTDQSGNFRIGDDLQINQSSGTISGRSFSKSLFNEMTPFILALS